MADETQETAAGETPVEETTAATDTVDSPPAAETEAATEVSE